MPNLSPPVTTVKQAMQYRQEILQALPAKTDFCPLMTLYLTETTTTAEIRTAATSKYVSAVKLYPAGATTNSASGVARLSSITPILEAMQKHDLPLLVHGEATGQDIDIFDREKVFIDNTLTRLVKDFPALRIVLEHATTRDAVQFVLDADATIAATITPQHLMFNRNVYLAGGIKPHYYCLPVIKREIHRQTLLNAATSGNPKFFLGTDSAPHLKHFKETSCGCAGCYSAASALEFYTEVFDQAGALDKLEGFSSFHGADFYHLPRNTTRVTLRKQAWKIPDSYPVDSAALIPLNAGTTINWKIQPADN